MNRNNGALSELETLRREYLSMRYPNYPPEYIAAKKYTDKTANGLTRCIIDYLNYKGHQAERINTTGRPIDTRQTVVDTLGTRRVVGSLSWAKSTSTKGSADISATIDGRSVKIEVKIGKDRLSDPQKAYKRTIEQAGGVYLIARCFDDFLTWYKTGRTTKL